MSIAALRQQLAEIIDGARPAMPGLATGLAALDAALPGHGLPRGRLTEIAGAPGSGLTTFARHLVASTLQAGGWVAYIDATRTLAPRDWAALGAHDGLWVVRPGDAARGAWCADILLRSGAFTLVVLDGAPALSRTVAVRLVRLARASDAAFVLLAPDGQHAGVAGALQLRVQRVPHATHAAHAATKRRSTTLDLAARLAGQSPAPSSAVAPAASTASTTTRSGPRQMIVTIEKGGPAQRVEVECAGDEARYAAHDAARRVREDPQVPDQRGVARRGGARRSERTGSARGSERAALGRAAPRPA